VATRAGEGIKIASFTKKSADFWGVFFPFISNNRAGCTIVTRGEFSTGQPVENVENSDLHQNNWQKSGQKQKGFPHFQHIQRWKTFLPFLHFSTCCPLDKQQRTEENVKNTKRDGILSIV
jgi:hypothetical protein